jgi:hypothetical protein
MLLRLAAAGQEIYLTGNPQITFFRYKYIKKTPIIKKKYLVKSKYKYKIFYLY